MSLSAAHVTWSAGDQLIVDDVSLDAAAGQVIGILGPNGAGKSSLMKLLAGVMSPERGVVHLDDIRLDALDRRSVAQRLAYVEQTADTAEDLLVSDVVDLGRIPHRGRWQAESAHDHEVVAAAARRTGVDHLLDRRWHTLSGGEQQRAHLARAFAQEGRTLLLDEPTNHLDIGRQSEILQAVRSPELAVVVALHDLNLALAHCDEVLVMDHGRAVVAGPPSTVLTEELVSDTYGVTALLRTFNDGTPPLFQYLPGR